MTEPFIFPKTKKIKTHKHSEHGIKEQASFFAEAVNMCRQNLLAQSEAGDIEDVIGNLQMLLNIVMKNLLSAAWKNSSRHKIGQFDYVNNISLGSIGVQVKLSGLA